MPDPVRHPSTETPSPRSSDVDIYGLTHAGKVRLENADHFLIASLHKFMQVHHTSLPAQYLADRVSGAKGYIFLVADGVGAGPGGEVASSTALTAIAEHVIHSMNLYYEREHEDRLLQGLRESVQHSHATVRGAAEREDWPSLATTLTMVAVRWPRAYLVHVGDSRCYRLRDRALERLSRDQTMAQDLVDLGALQPADLSSSPLAHVLSGAVGSKEPEPMVAVDDCRWEDVMLLCTDGLTKHVSDDEIRDHLLRVESAAQVCRDLADLALERGGSDNITVVVARLRSR